MGQECGLGANTRGFIKLCTKCGLIGHTRGQCTRCMEDIEITLYRQRLRIQDLHQVQYKFDALQPQFSNDLKAFHNRQRRWTTQIRYGFFNHPFDHAIPSHPNSNYPELVPLVHHTHHMQQPQHPISNPITIFLTPHPLIHSLLPNIPIQLFTQNSICSISTPQTPEL